MQGIRFCRYNVVMFLLDKEGRGRLKPKSKVSHNSERILYKGIKVDFTQKSCVTNYIYFTLSESGGVIGGRNIELPSRSNAFEHFLSSFSGKRLSNRRRL